MPLDEATTRFAFLMQRDLRRLTAREELHAGRGEEIKYDSVSRLATFENRRGDVAARLHGELLATYGTDDRILRWAWAGRSTAGADVTHGDVIFREGRARGVPQLAMSLVGDLDEADAVSLAKLGALVAHADGFHMRRVGPRVEFVGLFDRTHPVESSADIVAAGRFSVPPPPVAEGNIETPSGRRVAPYRSLPPIRELWEPRSQRPGEGPSSRIREPAREVFLPVANAALTALARSSPGYKQGLFVLTVDDDGKRRLGVQLVTLDAQGHLRAVDPESDLIEAAATMLEADRAGGNGPWRKLSVRITPKPDGGATLNVDVS